MPLKFLANMNISPETVGSLRGEGWDIVRVSDVLPENSSDRKILEWARGEDRVVISQDLDFSALLALEGFSKPSLISLRLNGSDPALVTRRLLLIVPLVDGELRQGCAISIADASFRVRRLPIK